MLVSSLYVYRVQNRVLFLFRDMLSSSKVLHMTVPYRNDHVVPYAFPTFVVFISQIIDPNSFISDSFSSTLRVWYIHESRQTQAR